jgi:hypothetical protein
MRRLSADFAVEILYRLLNQDSTGDGKRLIFMGSSRVARSLLHLQS